MKKPKVVLKNVRTFEGHDGLGLNADVWIDGVKCMHLYDGAYGGEYEYTYLAHGAKEPAKVLSLIKNLEDYVKSLPAEEWDFHGKKMSIDPNMDTFLNEIYESMQLEKKMKRAILVGIPNGTSYQRISWTGKALSAVPLGALQMTVNSLKKKLKAGEVILNTNLETLGVKV
jgi:hypothetical protein